MAVMQRQAYQTGASKAGLGFACLVSVGVGVVGGAEIAATLLNNRVWASLCSLFSNLVPSSTLSPLLVLAQRNLAIIAIIQGLS